MRRYGLSMDERSIEGVIFDLDGTLFDHHGAAEAGLRAWLAQLGVPTRDAIGLAGRVGPVLTSTDLGTPKPDSRSYLAGCHRLGLPAHAVLHVGDTYDLDVVAPRAAGLHAVHLDRPHPDVGAPHQRRQPHRGRHECQAEHPPCSRPDQINSLSALPDLLNALPGQPITN